MSILFCSLCGKHLFEDSKTRLLVRVSEKGVKPVMMECRPNCDTILSQEESILKAVTGDYNVSTKSNSSC